MKLAVLEFEFCFSKIDKNSRTSICYVNKISGGNSPLIPLEFQGGSEGGSEERRERWREEGRKEGEWDEKYHARRKIMATPL